MIAGENGHSFVEFVSFLFAQYHCLDIWQHYPTIHGNTCEKTFVIDICVAECGTSVPQGLKYRLRHV